MTDGTTDAASGGKAPAAKTRQPRRKAAMVMAKTEALSAAGAAAMTELSRLQRLMGQLVQGLSAMQDAQATHTEMLRALLTAATAPPDPETPLADALRYIAQQLTEQSLQARETQSVLARLPDEVASAVGREMKAALDAVR